MVSSPPDTVHPPGMLRTYGCRSSIRFPRLLKSTSISSSASGEMSCSTPSDEGVVLISSIALTTSEMSSLQESELTREWMIIAASNTDPAGIIAPGGLIVMSTVRPASLAMVPVEPCEDPAKAPSVSNPRCQPAGDTSSTS